MLFSSSSLYFYHNLNCELNFCMYVCLYNWIFFMHPHCLQQKHDFLESWQSVSPFLSPLISLQSWLAFTHLEVKCIWGYTENIMNSLSKDKAIQKHWKRSNWAYLSAKMTKESLENTVKLGNKCRHICMKLKAVIGPGEQKNITKTSYEKHIKSGSNYRSKNSNWGARSVKKERVNEKPDK